MSALDGRIRKLAREEAAAALTEASYSTATLETTGPDRLAELEKQVAELSARVDSLEKTAAASPAPRRTARKDSGE